MKKMLNNDLIKNINVALKLIIILITIIILFIIHLLFKEYNIYKMIYNIISIISPLLIGILLAYIFNPIVNILSKKIGRKLSVFLLYFIIILILFLLTNYIIPVFKEEINDLIKSMPSIIDNTDIFINKLFDNNINIDFDKYIINFVNKNVFSKTTDILNIFTEIFKFIGAFLISMIISLYFLLDFDKINNKLKCFLNKYGNKKINLLLIKIDNIVFSYIKGTFLIAIIVFIFSFISFELIHLKGSIFLAFYNALTNIIPYIGPYIGAIPIIIIAFSESKKLFILTIIILLIIQLIESYILHPLIMSKTMDLHPVTILISLLLFGYFFGIIGMVIAMPVVSALKTIIIFIINDKMLMVKK